MRIIWCGFVCAMMEIRWAIDRQNGRSHLETEFDKIKGVMFTSRPNLGCFCIEWSILSPFLENPGLFRQTPTDPSEVSNGYSSDTLSVGIV
ncbi:hypothetical protein CLU79DRAFT_734293 [Phycomyces nitens]|nr:hypothetical protein CLU79DRAFT_734293 [Phycomyces nitens]